VIAYPTEAVYGLGCDPLDGAAVSRLLALKGRTAGKGLILIAARFAQLAPFLEPLAPALATRVLATWPGPVTWLLPARPAVPPWLRGEHDTLAVRVTAHPLAAALCTAFGGALVSTSANRAGRPPARSPLAVRRAFDGELDVVLHGPLGPGNRPTEIRDGRSGAVVRAA
jgi:L-threonylcarbamoyladenylate synthase